MNAEQKLLALGENLSEGESGRTVCPFCDGGSSGELSFIYWRRGARIGGKCFRAKCGERTSMIAGTPAIHRRRPMQEDNRHVYTGGTVPISEELIDHLADEWGVDVRRHNLRVTSRGDVLIPIRDLAGLRRGDVVRQLKPYDNSRPKSVSYYDPSEYHGLAWFTPRDGEWAHVMVAVEDPISAMRLADHGILGCALLGVQLNPARLRDLVYPFKDGSPVHIALDADAVGTAISFAKRYGTRANIHVHRLYHDVKDMTEEELGNFLETLLSN